MVSSAESTVKAAAQPAKEGEMKESSASRTMTDLLQRGVERFIDVGKSMLDLAVQQNAAAVRAAKEALAIPAAGPVFALMDLGHQSLEKFVEAQKGILDLAARQTALVSDSFGGQADANASKFTSVVMDTTREMGERAITMQRILIDYAAKQNDLACEVMKPAGFQAAPPGRSIADSMRQGVDALMDTQKQLIEVASKPLRARAAKAND